MIPVVADVPRIYGPESLSPCILIEGSRTNACPRSNYNGTVSSKSLNAVANTSVGVTGNNDALDFSLPANGDYIVIIFASTGGSVANRTVSYSFYARGSGTLQFYATDNQVSAGSRFATVNLTPQWRLYTFSSTYAANTTATSVSLVIQAVAGAVQGQLWGWQAEVDAPFPSSLIQTSGIAVTRAADMYSFAVSGNPHVNFQPGRAKTINVAFRPLGLDPALVHRVFELKGAGATPRFGLRYNLGSLGVTYSADLGASGGLNGTFPNVANQWQVVTVTYDGATLRGYWNGLLIGTAVLGETITFTELVLGSASATNHFFGYIAPGAPRLGIPFADSSLWSQEDIDVNARRWLEELNLISLLGA